MGNGGVVPPNPTTRLPGAKNPTPGFKAAGTLGSIRAHQKHSHRGSPKEEVSGGWSDVRV